MTKAHFNWSVLFFPDKEKTETIQENTFVETDVKNRVQKYYNYDAKLRVRIRWKAGVLDASFSERIEVVNFNIGERVELAKWSTETQRCHNNTTHGKKKRTAKDINAKIEATHKRIDAIFNEFANKNVVPTLKQYRNRYNNVSETTTKDKTILDYFDDFVQKESTTNNWKESTIKKLSSIKNHLIAFGSTVSNFSFDTFDKDGLNAYVVFLRDVKGMQNSTLLNKISFLKWFLRWAKKEGINKNDAFLLFEPKMPVSEKKVIFLDWRELMTVYNYDFESVPNIVPENAKALERVRDVFCFSCFTSLRYSDVENLKRTDIRGNELHVTTIKTDDTLVIELNKYSKAILDKYKNVDLHNNKALPVITNQRMNDHLKDLGKICGLDTPINITYFKGSKRYDEVYPKYELLTTHCGRRTFICNALTMGIPPTTVMAWTGHSDYKSMQPYIGVAEGEKRKAMELFNR
jgi:integrase